VRPAAIAPAGDKNRRDVDPHRSHQHPGYDFVAVGDTHHSVELVRLDHRFHAVGDQLARRQRIFHPPVAHGDAVIHADGVELKRHAASRAHGVFNQTGELCK
jgi:hypothetical protein